MKNDLYKNILFNKEAVEKINNTKVTARYSKNKVKLFYPMIFTITGTNIGNIQEFSLAKKIANELLTIENNKGIKLDSKFKNIEIYIEKYETEPTTAANIIYNYPNSVVIYYVFDLLKCKDKISIKKISYENIIVGKSKDECTKVLVSENAVK